MDIIYSRNSLDICGIADPTYLPYPPPLAHQLRELRRDHAGAASAAKAGLPYQTWRNSRQLK